MKSAPKFIFDKGSIVFETSSSTELEFPSTLQWDSRIQAYRARACDFREVKTWVHRNFASYDDQVTKYETLDLKSQLKRTPRPYQLEGIQEWEKAGKRGLILLPTGTGKSFVAELAMLSVQRSTLILAPTIDLVHQWHDNLASSFHTSIGMIGGGAYEIKPITVSTYDSARIHMEHLGNQFGLIIFDEVHHLPGPSYLFAAECCVAPFRLGLTATLERPDGRHELLQDVVGSVVYQRTIKELSGDYLADYEVIQLSVELEEDELEAYAEARNIYKEFIRVKGISFRGPEGWSNFIKASSRSREGRRAMKAYLESKSLALSAPSKLKHLEGILKQHHNDRIIIFTNDNLSVYQISRAFLVPAITHQTDAKERKELLKKFNSGEYPCIVSSRVLNEGVDVPEANVGIVLSGTGSVREHVQRLGRILRKKPDKQAYLYEIITEGTVEKYVSERRREHDAYR